MSMMILGMFPFMLATAPYQTFEQNRSWRHVKNERVGRYPRYQYIGPGEDKVTLNGILYPEITGGSMSLSILKAMANMGSAWPLVEGTGNIYGLYVILEINETRSEFFKNGSARKIEFTLQLERVNEDLCEVLGDLAAVMPSDEGDAVNQLPNK